MHNIIHIENYDGEDLKMYTRLNETQLLHYHEPDLGIFIAESPKVIHRALDAGYEPISFLTEEKLLEGESKSVVDRLPEDIPVYTGDFDLLSKITGFKLTRGALCAMKRKELKTPQEICRNARRIVVLDDVENPTNVGAIFRSAAALGMDAVVMTKGSGDPLYRRSARVSVGTVFQIPWTYFKEYQASGLPVGMNYCISNARPNQYSYIDQLRDMGFKTVAMALREDSVTIDDPILRKEPKLAIIMGNEGEGLKDEIIGRSDYVITIPMAHEVDSLNVAAASAVAFWELGKH